MTLRNFVSSRQPRFIAAALIFLLATSVSAQTPPSLFRQRPEPTAPGRHATEAYLVDVDSGLLSRVPDRLWMFVPGKPDILFERATVERRGQLNMVWRGRDQVDPDAYVTLTLYGGLLFGQIQSNGDSYVIRPSNGRSVFEKIDPDSFAPEWGHDSATRGHEKVPPADGAEMFPESSTAPAASTAADGTIQIVLLSLYTPQARSAAGGTTQIQAQIQAAVDQANTAFINSNMMARFFLIHSEEVSYNDTGKIDNDLSWVTSNSGVASLRNSYGADMVSLIVANGGPYCGIGWVQRNPGSGFANFAYQVSDRDCLSNHTFAHEHGHNLGFEHDPDHSDVGNNPAQASYPWSFGHNVSGSFRTIMSYSCSGGCPRILNFSNPDIFHNAAPTGIANQRDNALTGDLTAPIVAAFRAGEPVTNNPPAFTSDPINKGNATAGQAYAASLAGNASDPDGDPLTFAKTGGPTWLLVSAAGALSGTPGAEPGGLNSFTVSVSDGKGGADSATLQINVIATLAAPTNLTATAVGPKQIDLSWVDNASGDSGFRIERSRVGGKFFAIATVSAGVTQYSDGRVRPGRQYAYRVRAYNGATNSDYSNLAVVTTDGSAGLGRWAPSISRSSP